MAKKRLQVYVSSTSEELAQERLVAIAEILERGHIPTGLELTARPCVTSRELVERWIHESDAFLLLVGGSPDQLDRASQEYEIAMSKEKPCAVVQLEPDEHMRDKSSLFQAFVSQLESDGCSHPVPSQDQIASIIRSILADFQARQDLTGWVQQQTAQHVHSEEHLDELSSPLAGFITKHVASSGETGATARPKVRFSGVQFEPIYGAPIIEVFVGISRSRQEHMKKNSLDGPYELKVRALVDTGASVSCMDTSIAFDLGLEPRGKISVHTPTTKDDPHDLVTYDVSLNIGRSGDTDGYFIPDIAVIDTLIDHQGFQLILGRDVLKSSRFLFDGTRGTFSIEF